MYLLVVGDVTTETTSFLLRDARRRRITSYCSCVFSLSISIVIGTSLYIKCSRIRSIIKWSPAFVNMGSGGKRLKFVARCVQCIHLALEER